MRAKIIPSENAVEIEGRRVFVDCSAIAADVALVQWFGANGTLHRPGAGGEEGAVERLTDLAPFQPFIAQAQQAIEIEDTPPPMSLADYQASAILLVDAEAGRARSRFITVTPGQEMTYLEKVKQARELLLDNEDYGESDYPLIFAEIGITAPEAVAVAEVILARYEAWKVIGAWIERERLSAKAAIEAAQSPEAIATIIEDLTWPIPE
jgi:hypothetical protein